MAVKSLVKNLYEVVVILKPNLGDEDLDKNISSLENAIKNYGGSVVKVDDPLKKKLMHKIQGVRDGLYVSCLFNSSPELPNLLKRSLSISDDVLRYMIVKRENQK